MRTHGALSVALVLFSAIALEACDPSLPAEIHDSFDITAAATEQAYRVRIYAPDRAAVPAGAAVLIVLDGDTQHDLVVDAIRDAYRKDRIEPVFMASVGYGLDLYTAARLRSLDYTPYGDDNPNGRADRFWIFVLDELLPEIEARYFSGATIDAANLALAGHSLGGLAVTYALLRDPLRARVRGFIAISPSLHFSGYQSFGWEAAMADGLPDAAEGVAAYFAWGGGELKRLRMLAADMTDRLAARPGLLLSREEIPYAEHFSVVRPAFDAGLAFIFPKGGR